MTINLRRLVDEALDKGLIVFLDESSSSTRTVHFHECLVHCKHDRCTNDSTLTKEAARRVKRDLEQEDGEDALEWSFWNNSSVVTVCATKRETSTASLL